MFFLFSLLFLLFVKNARNKRAKEEKENKTKEHKRAKGKREKRASLHSFLILSLPFHFSFGSFVFPLTSTVHSLRSFSSYILVLMFTWFLTSHPFLSPCVLPPTPDFLTPGICGLFCFFVLLITSEARELKRTKHKRGEKCKEKRNKREKRAFLTFSSCFLIFFGLFPPTLDSFLSPFSSH